MTDKDVLQEGKTREQLKAEKKAERKQRKQARLEEDKRWIRIRLLPIWLRLILVVLLLAGSLVFGLMIGYGVIGSGEPGDILKKETWQHIIDIVIKE